MCLHWAALQYAIIQTALPIEKRDRTTEWCILSVRLFVVQFGPISPKWKLVEVPNLEEMVPLSHVTENFILVHGHVEFWNR